MSKTIELLGAIANGCGNFNQLIEEIDDINGYSKSKERTALHQACLYNNIPVLEKLVSISDINLNMKDIQWRTPLHIGCLKNHHQAVAKLVETPGIHVNTTDRHGETPLHLACSNAYSDQVVDILLNAPGIDVNVKDNDDQTPLHKACSAPNHRTVAKLIETSRVDVNAKDNSGKTPLFLACGHWYQCHHIIELLKAPGIDVNVNSRFDGTPLHNAARNNNVQAMSNLLEVPGIKLNEIDLEQKTPLHIACINKKYEAVVKLINTQGVDVNATDCIGNTPLHYAGSSDDYEVFSALIDLPAINVNAVNNLGKTPLHLSCENAAKYANRCQVVKKFLAIPGIDVNIRDNSGETAIMAAASNRDGDILKLLVDDKRVNMDSKNNDEKGLMELITETCVCSKTDCLDIIQKARRIRELENSDQVDESHDNETVQADQELENWGANIRNLYIEKIEKTNQKKNIVILKLRRNADLKEAAMKQMTEKHNKEKEMMTTKSDQLKMELEQEEADLEKQLAEVKQRLIDVDESMISNTQEMSRRHKEEKMTLEEKYKDEHDQKNLDNLMKISDQLIQEMEKLDIDSNVLGRLEEAKEILECPICMRTRMPPTRIWMCEDSHIICENCRDQLDGNECPTCRSKEINLRAFTAEKLTRALFDQ